MTGLRRQAPVLVGSLALLLAALLVWGLVPRWQAEQASADRRLQQRAHLAMPRPVPAAAAPADQRLAAALPAAGAAPQRLAALVDSARQQGLRIDSVRQSAPVRLGAAPAMLAAERLPLRLTGSGPYSAWRGFVALALQQDDALLLDQLHLSRSGPHEAMVAADLQWSLLQRLGDSSTPAAPAGGAAPAPQLPTRAADWPAPAPPALAAWQAPPAAPPPVAANRQAALAAAAAASRPPPLVFPYRWIGQLDDGGAPQVLLASAQRSVGVRLGAMLDGRWRLQRNAAGQLLAQALPDGDTVPVPGAPPAPVASSLP